MPITMADIRGLKSRAEAVNLLTKNAISTHQSVTLFPALARNFPGHYANYLADVKKAQGHQARSAIVANMIKETVGFCNPVAAQLFFLSEAFVKNAITTMNKDTNANKLKESLKDYKNAYVDPKPEWLTAYRDSYCAFRTMMQDQNFEGPDCLWMTSTVKAELSVGTNVADVLAMITRMKELRAKALGNATSGCEHLTEAKRALSGDLSQPLLTSWKNGIYTERSVVGGAYNYEGGNYTENPTGKMLLLSTALTSMIQNATDENTKLINKIKEHIKNSGTMAGIAKENGALLARAIYEAEKLATGQTLLNEDVGAGKFVAQMMNIDPLWFTFFVAVKIGEITDIDAFYKFQRGIYGACIDYKGKANMESMFRSFIRSHLPGFDKMITANSNCKNIYLPPWVYTYSRTYDIAACIAPCDIGNPNATIKNPAISWRYFLCLDFGKKKDALTFVTSLWNVEAIANEGEDPDIRLSERILHQVIMGRNSPLANTNSIIGNALNVKIID